MTYDGINDYTNYSANTSLDLSTFTYIIWWKPDSLPFTSYEKIISKSDATKGFWLNSFNTGSATLWQNKNSGQFATSDALNSSFNCIAMTTNSSANNLKVYTGHDATPDDTVSRGSVLSSASIPLKVGGEPGQIFAGGQMTTFAVFDRELTGTEIKAHCDEGKDFNPYIVTTTNFTIELKDYYNGTNLKNFNAYIGSDVFNDSGTGTITTDILSTNGSLFNITVGKQNYFNTTYLNYDVSSNLNAFVNGTNITFRVVFNNTNITANVSNTTLTDLDNTLSWVSETGFFNINPPPLVDINYQIKCNRSVFETRNFTINFTARDENEYIIYVEPTLNNLTFLDLQNSSPIPNAQVNITYPVSGEKVSLTTNANGSVFFSYVKNNVTEFGNYTIEFNKFGYNLITIVEEVNASNVPVDETYNVGRATLFINVFHRTNLTLLTGVNVTLNLLGVFQQITDNGTFTYQNLSLVSQDYTLQAIADGYGTEQVTFSYNNQDNLTVNVYLLDKNDTNAGTLFVNVIDEYYFRQIGASVSLMEYSANDNGFITVSECLTNTNGECVFDIELNTKTYIITASKTIDGRFFSANSGTAGEIIKTDQEVRQLILRTTEDFDSISVTNLIYNVTESFVNNISQITVYFETIDNTATTVCVEYFEINGFTKTTVQLDCTTSSGGISNVGTSYSLNRSNQYQAQVYNVAGDVEYVLRTFNYPSIGSTSEVFGELGLNDYIILAVFVLLLGISLYAKNITLFFILSIFSSWLLYGIFPQDLLIEFVMGINIISGFGWYISRKKRQEG